MEREAPRAGRKDMGSPMNARHTGALAFLVLASVVSPVVAEEMRVETLPVRSRSAEELAEALRPIAGNDATIAATDDHLVVRASPATLAKIEKALKSLDPPPRPLWISVDQQTDPSTTGRSAEFTVETRENGVVEQRRTRTLEGGSLSIDPSEAPTSTERLRILEGQPAFVRFNRAVPMPSSRTPSSAAGTVLEPGKQYRDADLAFAVVPRLSDGRVALEITSLNDTVDNRGDLQVARARATVSGPLGDWLDVGDAIRSVSTSSGSLSEDQRVSEVGALRVRIEAVQ